MKRTIALCSLAVLTTAACISPALAAPRRHGPRTFAPTQTPATPTIPNQSATNQLSLDQDNADVRSVSRNDKAKSDDLMRAGLAALQSAAAALQAGNGAAALQSLRTAYDNLLAAKPIYHGHRGRSFKFTIQAGLALDQNKPNSIKRAQRLVGSAIAEAQFALKYW